MFAQESVMDIQRQAFQEWYIANHHDGDIHPNQQLLEWSEKGGFYFASSVEDLWEAWQAANAQAVLEGFVEKTESNTHHYFKLKDWDEWTCIDGIKDAITSDHDINAIVEVECLEVIGINNKPCFALLAFGKRHGTEVKFFDTEEEAIEAQEQSHECQNP